MPTWNCIFEEIQKSSSTYDTVRYKYLKLLTEYTKRNVISYYSGWLTKPNALNSDINDTDIQGFMSAINGLDCSVGLDLILHTPGGSPTASESIVNYLRSKFKDIRVIVPQMAMSAGTMIACSANQIIMGQHSSLGPIDPQLGGIPAYSIIQEFKDAQNDLANNPQNIEYWKLLLAKYPPAFIMTAQDSIKLSDDLLTSWLKKYMFSNCSENLDTKIGTISAALNEHDNSKSHARHFNIGFCKEIGLNVNDLESDNCLQDLVLSLHHAYTLTLSATSAIKIIENQNAVSYIACVNNK